MDFGNIFPRTRTALTRRGRREKPFDGFRRDIEALHRHLDRLFEEAWIDEFGSTALPEFWARGEIVPQIDVTEDDKAFYVHAELPGMEEKDLEVSVSDRTLTIRGEKKEDKEAKDKERVRQERLYGAFRRSIELPAAVDESKISAAFRKGVLTVELPRTREAQQKSRRIEVKAQ